MDGHKSVTAIFTQDQHTLTTAASPSNGGSVSGGGTYSSGTQVTITATPTSGWTFTNWSGDCSGAGACTVTMDGNKSVTANFIQDDVILSTSVSPSHGGSVSGAGAYSPGTQVTLTATPTSGWNFTIWSGDCSGAGVCTVTMDGNKSVTANFSQGDFTLGTSVSPSNGGSVSGAGNYSPGTQVTVTHSANSGWSFINWSGACSGSGSCVVNMDGNKSVTGNFIQDDFVLTTFASPSNGGSVSGAGNYSPGTQVTVTPTPTPGWSFINWSGACSGSGSCVVNMDGNKSVTAIFTQDQYTLTTAASPSNGGSVFGAGTYPSGTQVTVTHSANSGWSFSAWSGACPGASSCVVTMDANKTVTANFQQIGWTVLSTFAVGGAGNPLSLAVDNGLAYVGIYSGNLKVVDLASQTVVATVPFAPYPNARPGHIALSSTHAYIPLSNLGSNGQIAKLDRSTNQITSYIPVGPEPWGAAIHNGKLYVTNNIQWSNGDPATVKVINLATEAIIATITVGVKPTSIAIDHQSGKAYVTNYNSKSVSVIDTNTNSVVSTIPLNDWPADVTITGGKAYVTTLVTNSNGWVKVIDIATDQIVNTLSVGRDGWRIASLSGNVFVANQSSGTISVIDTSLGQVDTTLAAGSLPTGIATDFATNKMYAANQGDNTITVVGIGPIP